MSEQNLLVLGTGISLAKNDGVLRFENYCKKLDIPFKIIGEGVAWKGGDMAAGQGGGQKILQLVKELDAIDDDTLIVVCDTFDLFPVAGVKEIIDKFNLLCKHDQCGQSTPSCGKPDQIIFSSEIFCWPDKKLADLYPNVNSKYRFLCSGSYMGYKKYIYELVKNCSISERDDDQLFFTQKLLTSKNNIILDYGCHLFQALNGVRDDIVVHKNRIYNRYTNSYPVFIHGNGPSKPLLNQIENYIEPRSPDDFKNMVLRNRNIPGNVLNKIFYALYINSSKFINFNLFYKSFKEIENPNSVIFIYDRSNSDLIKNISAIKNYTYKPDVLNYVYEDFLATDCQYYFLLEQQCIITHKNIIPHLVDLCHNHRIIAPLLKDKKNPHFSNFWGALDQNGYYKRSDDYFNIINKQIGDCWNVPYVSGAIMMKREVIANFDLSAENKFTKTDVDMALCHNLRNNTLFMYVVNMFDYGYLNF